MSHGSVGQAVSFGPGPFDAQQRDVGRFEQLGITSGRLSQLFTGAGRIENIIGDLKGQPDILTIRRKRIQLRGARLATLTFFRNLPAEAWLRTGIASDNPFSVRAVAYIVAGHAAHHVAILQERYL